MTQIIGDAKHLKSRPLSGEIESGQVWEFDGSAFVPAAGPTAVGAIASGAYDIAAAVGADFSGFYSDEYQAFLDNEFYPLSGKADTTSGVAAYASGVVDDVSGQSGFVLASGAGLIVFRGTPASGKIPKLSGANLLTDLYWANDETATVSGVVTDVMGGRLEYASSGQIKWRFSHSNQVRLWNPTLGQWEIVSCTSEPTFPSSGQDLNGSGLVAGCNYDVFAQYASPSGFDLVLNKWSSDTARSVSPAQWQGVLCYDNTSDDGKKRRYIGSVRLVDNSGTPNFAWSATQKFLWNYYNRQGLYNQITDSTAHSYTSGIYRPWNNNQAATLVEWLEGYLTDVHAIDILFAFTPTAAGDRCITRVNLNGTGIDYKTSVGAAAVFHRDAVTQHYPGRTGYNYAYVEEYGYSTSPTYNSVKLQVTLNQ
ncbi:MAG: hypothetical protein LDL33_11865 [Desulfomonile sp.]|nr:hypothetical protein [Desulfomonile sp.]